MAPQESPEDPHRHSSHRRRRRRHHHHHDEGETAHERERSRKIRFVWGGAGTIKGKWVLGLLCYYDRPDKKRDGLAISLRGALLYMATLTVIGYFAAAAAAAALFASKPLNTITYSDLVLAPVQWKAFNEKRGQMQIAQGQAAMDAGRYGEGFMLLRTGLSRYPYDKKARLTVANFYQVTGQRSLALSTLEGGLEQDKYPGLEYLKGCFGFYEQGEEWERAAKLAKDMLALPAADTKADLEWLQLQRARALLGADQPQAAMDFIDSVDAKSKMLQETRIMGMLELGKPVDALAALDAWEAQGADKEQILRLRVRASREAGKIDAMEKSLDALRQMSPANPRPYVYRVVQLAMADRQRDAEKECDDYLFRFGADISNVLMLLQPLGEINNSPLVDRVVEHARAHGFQLKPFLVVQVQTHAANGEWKAASKALDEIRPSLDEKKYVEAHWLELMRALIAAGTSPDENGRESLLGIVRKGYNPLKIFKTFVPPLFAGGRLDTAHDMLQVALKHFPESRFVQTEDKKVAAAIDARERAKPKVELTPPVASEAKDAFAQIDERLQRGAWSDAQGLISDIRRAHPLWLAKEETGLLERLMEAQIGSGDTDGLANTAQVYLLSDSQRVRRVVEFARDALGKGKREAAVTLMRSARSRAPTDPEVLALSADLEKKDPAPAPQAGG